MDFFHTHISKKAYKLVKQTLNSTFLSEGKQVDEFENKLNQKLGLINPVAVNSGTSALHLALIASGVKQGDEIIIPAQTFVATGLAVLMVGAKPVFADITLETGNIDPKSIKKKITNKTKAIIPVHWGGYPCDLDEINKIAKAYNLTIIEDAAHALGSTYHGRPIGAISHFTCFSFQAIKHLTTGDGGAVCCLDIKKAERLKALRWFGIDRASSKPSILGEREYDIKELGFKYHLNDYGASLGLANLQDFPKILKRRQNIARVYRQKLKKIPGLSLLNYKENRISAYWLFTILVEDRENFIKKLKEKNIPTSVVHLRIDHNSIFGGLRHLPNQERFNQKQISLPIHNGLTSKNLELIVNTIKTGW